MIPLEGEAFFTSQIKDSSGFARRPESAPPLPRPMARHWAWSTSRLFSAWSAATRSLAWAASWSKIVMSPPPGKIADGDELLQRLQCPAGVDELPGQGHAVLHGVRPAADVQGGPAVEEHRIPLWSSAPRRRGWHGQSARSPPGCPPAAPPGYSVSGRSPRGRWYRP